VKLKKTGKHLVFWDVLVIEEHSVSFQHLYRDKIYLPAWRRPDCGGQINPNTFHVSLAQAHHHEAGEQKEHDVDQRDDLDARPFMRNW
jgi:hypothetical protein